MNGISLPVVHPAFQNLKRNGRLLHLLAAGLIVTHAFSHFNDAEPSKIYLACLLLIAIDIIVLVVAVKNLLYQQPRLNLFFRAVEWFFFLGIGIEMMTKSNWITAAIHLILAIAYIYLFYCEKKLSGEERVGIHHTGISIPALPESRFFLWSNISSLQATYSTIDIETSSEKNYHFDLQENLEFEELDQIHEFCRHYLGTSS